MSIAPLPTFATLGEMLKYLRRRARLTQRELSIAVGYSESQISRLEQNERTTDVITLQAVFVPALSLESQPEVVRQLVALATAAHTSKGNDVVEAEPLPVPHHLTNPSLENLPARLTSFIGRDEAIASLGKLIPVKRLVTLTGVGGVGKTSLAQIVGSGLVSTFRDGVRWVELASLTDANLIPKAVAGMFKLPETNERTYLETLTNYLRNRHLLLILDNCEHLIDACADVVSALLRGCLQLHILTTSREALRVQGEVEWVVFPLTIPDLSHETLETEAISAAEMLDSYEGVRLFVERARTTQPTFAWDDQTAALVAPLCSQLDGIPLAIELATSRLKGMTVNELAARLDDRLRLLTGGMRTALPRHQTLQAAMDWSYELLSGAERSLLRRLSVFAGGCTLDAVEAIADAEQNCMVSIPNPVDVLLQLVNKSLVVAETRSMQTRYHLLETIRHYAADKLHKMDEVTAVRALHLAHFLALAAQSKEPTLAGRRFAAWQERIKGDIQNMRSALAWSFEQADGGEQCLQLAGALWPYSSARGDYREGQFWLENALARATTAYSSARASALIGMGHLLQLSGPTIRRMEIAEEALLLCQQSNDRYDMAHSYLLMGESALVHADFGSARGWLEKALDLFDSVQCTRYAGVCLANLLAAWLQLGQVERAAPLLEDLFSRGNGEGGYLYDIGMACNADCFELAALFKVDKQRGSSLFQREITRQRRQNTPEILAALLHAYGRQLMMSNEPQELEECYEVLTECLRLWRQADIKWSRPGGTAHACLDLGQICTFAGKYEMALAYERESSETYDDVGDLHGVAWAQMCSGWAAFAQGDLALAVTSFQNSLELSPHSDVYCISYALTGLAEILRRRGDLSHAGLLFGGTTRLKERATDEIEYVVFKKFPVPIMQAARTYLDDPGFAAAWAKGEVLATKELICAHWNNGDASYTAF